MLSDGSFTADHGREYLGDWNRFPARSMGRRTNRRTELLGAAFALPSFIAEVIPLILFWSDHPPVWQMSAMMFGAWASTWWLTWVLAVILRGVKTKICGGV
jgi:hypothetical protein